MTIDRESSMIVFVLAICGLGAALMAAFVVALVHSLLAKL